jgi:hypothetical protein
VEGDDLGQPGICSVDVALLGKLTDLLARKAQSSDGTAEAAVRDLDARLEDEVRAVVLERGAR